MFTPDGEVVQAADALYKRPILLLRGSFNPVLKLHQEMIRQGRKVFANVMDKKQADRAVELCEITMNNLLRDGDFVDHEDFLDRADSLQRLGKTVLISRCPEFHRITTFLSRYTSEPIAVILSIGLLNELFKEKWSENLAGGILESFGRLFKNSVQLFVYPWKQRKTDELVSAESFIAPKNFTCLYDHFLKNKKIVSIDAGDEGLLEKTSREVMQMIEAGEEDWEKWVPQEAQFIARRVIRNQQG